MFIYFTGHTKRLCKWLLFIPKVSKGTAITGKQKTKMLDGKGRDSVSLPPVFPSLQFSVSFFF